MKLPLCPYNQSHVPILIIIKVLISVISIPLCDCGAVGGGRDQEMHNCTLHSHPGQIWEILDIKGGVFYFLSIGRLASAPLLAAKRSLYCHYWANATSKPPPSPPSPSSSSSLSLYIIIRVNFVMTSMPPPNRPDSITWFLVTISLLPRIVCVHSFCA